MTSIASFLANGQGLHPEQTTAPCGHAEFPKPYRHKPRASTELLAIASSAMCVSSRAGPLSCSNQELVQGSVVVR